MKLVLAVAAILSLICFNAWLTAHAVHHGVGLYIACLIWDGGSGGTLGWYMAKWKAFG